MATTSRRRHPVATPPGSPGGSPERRWRGRTKVAVFAGVCAVALVATVLSVSHGSRVATIPGQPASHDSLPAAGLAGGPYLLFRSTSLNHDYGLVGLVPGTDPGGPRILSSLKCDRVDYSGSRGICLSRPTTGVFNPATSAIVFDDHFRTLSTVETSGYPSRAQVSPDGSLASVTTFVSGDSYATMGTFSTRTEIIDLKSGKVLFGLEKLSVSRDGHPFQAVDFNFWGVTFANDNRHFYATLGTGGRPYLIQGDVVTRTASVVQADVECPSLSPDNHLLAFKKRRPGATVSWQLSVLDLRTMTEHPLAETQTVDDQASWLDNATVAYGLPVSQPDINAGDKQAAVPPVLTTGAALPTNTWEVPADGTGAPTLLEPGAWSTALTRLDRS